VKLLKRYNQFPKENIKEPLWVLPIGPPRFNLKLCPKPISKRKEGQGFLLSKEINLP